MIAPGAFDGDHAIADLVLCEGQPDLSNGGVKVGSVVLDRSRRDEVATVEVGEQELGADLVAVEADDAKMFGPTC